MKCRGGGKRCQYAVHARESHRLKISLDTTATAKSDAEGGNDAKTGEQTGEQNEASCAMPLFLRGL